tara:strand:- start:7649 stop:8071 length:423 start_codon:yes stop_codon:yes gene_type:complete
MLSRKYYKAEVQLSCIPKWKHQDLQSFKLSRPYDYWEKLTDSIKTFGYGYKPIVIYPLGPNPETGLLDYFIKDGNHRFTVLSELYGPNHIIKVYIKRRMATDNQYYNFENSIKEYKDKCMSKMVEDHQLKLNKIKKLKRR